jgi:hypothetical protein
VYRQLPYLKLDTGNLVVSPSQALRIRTYINNERGKGRECSIARSNLASRPGLNIW